MTNPCTWYSPWRDNSDILKISECWLWDEQKQACERNEPCEWKWAKEVKGDNLR